jgi:hypothetical protein
MSAAWTGVIPIYINNCNWLTSTRAIADFFASIPGATPIIVDNGSTYPPLVEWYESECPYRVIRLGSNVGHYAPWRCGAELSLEAHGTIFGSAYYAVTDSDLSFADCPPDVLDVLISGLAAYPDCVKAGVSLELRDIPGNSIAGQAVKEWEEQFWRNRRDDRFFEADIDTTFAVYRAGARWGKCLRSDRPYTARHLPWHITGETLTDEQRYYLARATIGHWTSYLQNALGLRPADCAT